MQAKWNCQNQAHSLNYLNNKYYDVTLKTLLKLLIIWLYEFSRKVGVKIKLNKSFSSLASLILNFSKTESRTDIFCNF